VSTGIYIDFPSASLLNDRCFQWNTGRFHSSLLRVLAHMKKGLEAQGVQMHTADLLPPQTGRDRHIYISIGNHANYPRLATRRDVVLSAFMVTESPIVEPRIYRGLAHARHYFKRIFSCIPGAEIRRFTGADVECLPLRWPIDFRGVDMPLWSRSDRGFLVMVNMNKLPRLPHHELFTERMRAVEVFSRTGEIDLYGVGWDKASARMGTTWLPWTLRRAHIAWLNWIDRIHPAPLLSAARKVYKGELETKWETLSQYDFALCFENIEIKGWLTEKLFETLRVGTIPIYWGATDIKELVPIDCFIDMTQFAGYADLRAFLKSLESAAIRRYRNAGREFLESDAFGPFSEERFSGIFRDLLEQDAGVLTTI
jgi:alpha(1,3/1,4) fucosyltransferase